VIAGLGHRPDPRERYDLPLAAIAVGVALCLASGFGLVALWMATN
jgi:hypothetical protein